MPVANKAIVLMLIPPLVEVEEDYGQYLTPQPQANWPVEGDKPVVSVPVTDSDTPLRSLAV